MSNQDCEKGSCVNNVCGGIDLSGDDDADGVPNARDRCPHTPTGKLVDFFGCGTDDADQDHISDDWETYYGMNPADPNDALVDTDGDGLRAIDEFLRGTDPNNSDSDNDGAADTRDRCLNTPRGVRVDTRGCGPDADGDGLPDEFETSYGLDPADPADAVIDSDGETVSNLGEFTIGANARGKDSDLDGQRDDIDRCVRTPYGSVIDAYGCGTDDSDKDGASDDCELNYGLNPQDASDGAKDPDSDGLTNTEECTRHTDPFVSDTDKDGVADGTDICPRSPPGSTVDRRGCGTADADEDGISDDYEQHYQLNPSDPSDALLDSDGDGLTNLDEFRLGSDPHSTDTDQDGVLDLTDRCPRTRTGARVGAEGCTSADADRDGMPDEYENDYGFDPKNPDDAKEDFDGDGAANIIEYRKGMDPTRLDTDDDGITDDNDRCPRTLHGNLVAGEGCATDDADADGVPDAYATYFALATQENDPDRDTLSNAEEFDHNTHPVYKDTDNDGVSDSQELADHTDPLDPDSYLTASPKSTGVIVFLLILILFGAAGGAAYVVLRRVRRANVPNNVPKNQPLLASLPPQEPDSAPKREELHYEPLTPKTISTLKNMTSSDALRKLQAKAGSMQNLRKHNTANLSDVRTIKKSSDLDKLHGTKDSFRRLDRIKKKPKPIKTPQTPIDKLARIKKKK